MGLTKSHFSPVLARVENKVQSEEQLNYDDDMHTSMHKAGY